MAPQTALKLSYEDYVVIPADRRRHEIIDGEHYVNPSPNTRHQTLAFRLTLAVGSFVSARQLGSIFFAPFDVLLTEHDIVEPDLIFVSTARKHIVTEANIQGVPDLLVEILSPGNRRFDKRVKYDTYERAGVPEYWIVDPEDEVVEVYRHAEGRYARAEVGDTLTSPSLPGFTLRLRDLVT